MSKCNYVLSRENDSLPVLYPADTVECLLEAHHNDDHLAKIEEDRYIYWKNDDHCGCLPEDGYCGCFLYSILDKSQVDEILKGRLTK